MNQEQNNNKQQQEKNTSLNPDPETLHKTDPQENMEGPFSSVMHKTGEAFQTKESKEEATERRDKNM